MLAEGLVLNVTEQALEEGVNSLPPKSKAIVVNAVFGVIGAALCILAVSRLVNVLFVKKQQQPQLQPA